MKVSLNWLREFVAFPGSVDELCEVLTMSGIEVEDVITTGVSIEKVVVAQILESTQHPNADRLSVCRVNDGAAEPRQIVCGAKNYKVGDKVPLAQPGAVLPGDFTIKVGKLRGVESQGMMCSAKELGLSEDAEGLLILPADAQVGAPLSELYPADTVLDLEITPNRPDLLSHFGLAREISALTGLPLKPARLRGPELNYSHGVQISADECPVYTARCISSVTVAPSPEWLKRRLLAVGLRPINNIVDVTNYVMLELGQPLHAFDAAKLEGDLQVRMAAEGEEFHALDGRTYKLTTEHLVIADDKKAAALAGVMGGEATGVTDATTSIWLESACFQSTSIRRTSRGLGLMSDSSYRFEREVDPALVLVASQRATELIAEVAGGTAGELRLGFGANSQFGFDEQGATEGVEYIDTVPLRRERCAAVLGVEITDAEIADILTGFQLKQVEGGWAIPSFRGDLSREVDLIEEIARTTGLEEIPGRTAGWIAPSSNSDRRYDRLMALRRALSAYGLHEARTLTLISEAALERQMQPGAVRRVKNPLNEDQVVLRPSLLPGLLQALEANLRVGQRCVRLYEAGRVYAVESPEERQYLALVLTGSAAATWRGGEAPATDLYELKGVLSRILALPLEFQRVEHPRLGLAVEIRASGTAIGFGGILRPQEARDMGASASVVFAEIDLTSWLDSEAAPSRYREIPRYPAVTRDIAMLAPAALDHAAIVQVLEAAQEPLLTATELFDIFTDPTGEKIPVGQKSLAYSLTYRAGDRTLTANEVDAAHGRLKERLKESLGIALRE